VTKHPGVAPTGLSGLQALRDVLRSDGVADPKGAWATVRSLPDGVTVNGFPNVFLKNASVQAIRNANAALYGDLRFEHLDKRIEDVVWEFAANCLSAPDEEHLSRFDQEYGRSPVSLKCFLPVEHLKITEPTDICGLLLLPIDDPRLPPREGFFDLSPPVVGVASVTVAGTHPVRMAQRAQSMVRDRLRLLRFALRDHHSIPDEQLRFRLGAAYALEGHGAGWRMRPDAAWELTVGPGLASFAREHSPVVALDPTTDLDRRVRVAMEWLEKAGFAAEPLISLLYGFFALEALLGNKAEGKKADGLAFRQALLSTVVDGHFTSPSRTWSLYGRVRSSAVHGEIAPDLDPDDVQAFLGSVRRALKQVLSIANREGIQTRRGLLRFLNRQPAKSELEDWFVERSGGKWSP
jgi:hypothetical protein